MDTIKPYENMTTIHSLAFIGIATAAVILYEAGLLDTIERQLILLAILLPAADIPHGSLDYSIAGVTYPHVAVIIMAQRGEILGNRSVMLSV